MSWKVIPNTGEVVNTAQPDWKFTLSNDSPKVCSCCFQTILKMPCEHVLRYLSDENKEDVILDYIDRRWMSTININKSDSILEELTKIIEKEKKKIPKEERKQAENDL